MKRAFVGVMMLVAGLFSVPQGAAARPAPAWHLTVEQLQSKTFATCMEHRGQPGNPAPGGRERRENWSVARRDAYWVALVACEKEFFAH